MKSLFWILILFCSFIQAQPEPMLVQSQVQSDLENLLSKMIPPEQFLVQVNAEIGQRQERQLIEGETVLVTPEKPKEPVKMMPGFLPEFKEEPPKEPQHTRQVFRMVDKTYLKQVRASVTLDDELNATTTIRAKAAVQNYLRNSYPNQAVVTFSSLLMLKPKKEVKETPPPPPPVVVKPPEEPKKPEVVEPEEPEPSVWEEYGPYGLLALFGLILWLFFSRSQAQQRAAVERARRQAGNLNPALASGMNPFQSLQNPFQFMRNSRFGTPFNEDSEEKNPPRDYRKILLHRFLSRSQAFKRYYHQLSLEAQEELYGCMKGAAYENLLQGLAIKIPPDVHEPAEKDEVLARHEKDFEEFIQAKDWQERQFFGFLQDLSDEQMIALVNHQGPLEICLMLRFLNPKQSALVLESIPAERRREVLSQAHGMNHVPFAEILSTEKAMRETVRRMPSHLFGSAKEDIEFWGGVLTESKNQDEILEDIEKTNPEIYMDLKKFKFKLEEAASLPNNMLSRILAEADNEELCLALSTCPDDVTDVFLEVLSPKRSRLIENQFSMVQTASEEERFAARQKLTKRFREVIK